MSINQRKEHYFITVKVHDFKQSLVLGEKGEAILLDWFKKRPKTKDIVDVRKDEQYQTEDIDFLIIGKDGIRRSVEVKTDSYKSGNFFYETVSAVETNSLGCMYKSKAEYLVYYFINMNRLFIIEFKEFNDWMRKLIAEGNPKLRCKQFNNNRYDGVSQYTSQGYTIPIQYVLDNFHGKLWEPKLVDLEKSESKELN